MVIGGYAWLYLVIPGYAWLYLVMDGYTWLLNEHPSMNYLHKVVDVSRGPS